MHHSLTKRIVVMIALGTLSIQSVSAAVPTITATNINRVSAPIVRTLPDATSKAWANARLDLYK
jgi:hypothetical protein